MTGQRAVHWGNGSSGQVPVNHRWGHIARVEGSNSVADQGGSTAGTSTAIEANYCHDQRAEEAEVAEMYAGGQQDEPSDQLVWSVVWQPCVGRQAGIRQVRCCSGRLAYLL